MSTDIRAEIETRRKEIADLEAKAATEAEALEDLERKRIEDERANAEMQAIPVLMALDKRGILKTVDNKLFLVIGGDEFEIEVAELFESVSTWSRRHSKGASKGIWYSLQTHSINGQYKTRKWKKPESAYRALVELHDDRISSQKRVAEQSNQRSIAREFLQNKYPQHEIKDYKGNQLWIANGGFRVAFSFADGDVAVCSVENRYSDDSGLIGALAGVVLGWEVGADDS